MSKHIKVGIDATDKMVKGVNKLTEVVGKTLGADGKHIFVEHPSAKIPISTKDGATVATWINLEDKFENIGAGMVKYAANKTAIDAGDGTTTTTIMANSLVTSGFQMAKDEHMRVRNIVNGIETGRDESIKFLSKGVKNIDYDSDMVKKVAMVSSNYDEEISSMIADAISKIGKNAVINVEKNLAGKTDIEIVQGVTVDSGYSHPVFVNTNHNECILEDVAIILCDQEILNVSEIQHIFQSIEANEGRGRPSGITRSKGESSSHRPVKGFLVIARDVQGDALSSLAKTKAEGGPVAIARAPYGDDFNVIMRDLAIATGGKLIAENEGLMMSKMNPHTDCGWAKKIILGVDKLTIIGGEPDEDVFKERMIRLEKQEQKETDTKEKEIYRQRAARLTGRVAKLVVGGDNDAQINERKDRADDAAQAVRSALEEGVLVGGAVSLLLAAEYLDKPKNGEPLNNEVQQGINIMIEALESPFFQLMENSGYNLEESKLMRDKILSKNGKVGYNALTGNFEDLYKNGIVDPYKVLRCAIENSVTVANQLLNTGAAMYFLPNDDPRSGRNSN